VEVECSRHAAEARWPGPRADIASPSRCGPDENVGIRVEAIVLAVWCIQENAEAALSTGKRTADHRALRRRATGARISRGSSETASVVGECVLASARAGTAQGLDPPVDPSARLPKGAPTCGTSVSRRRRAVSIRGERAARRRLVGGPPREVTCVISWPRSKVQVVSREVAGEAGQATQDHGRPIDLCSPDCGRMNAGAMRTRLVTVAARRPESHGQLDLQVLGTDTRRHGPDRAPSSASMKVLRGFQRDRDRVECIRDGGALRRAFCRMHWYSAMVVVASVVP